MLFKGQPFIYKGHLNKNRWRVRQVSEERRRAHRRNSLRYCPVTVAQVTYYVRYELTWNHCATKQPQEAGRAKMHNGKQRRRDMEGTSALGGAQRRSEKGSRPPHLQKITIILLEQQTRRENAGSSTRECVQMDANNRMRRDNCGDGSKRCSEHPGQWASTRGGHGIDHAEEKSRAYKENGN